MGSPNGKWIDQGQTLLWCSHGDSTDKAPTGKNFKPNRKEFQTQQVPGSSSLSDTPSQKSAFFDPLVQIDEAAWTCWSRAQHPVWPWSLGQLQELKERLPPSHGASGALPAFKRVFLGVCLNCAHCFPARKEQSAFQHGNDLPFYE